MTRQADAPAEQGLAGDRESSPAPQVVTTSEALALLPTGKPMLDYLPVGLFGSTMGLTGLSVAWRLAHARYGAPEWVALAVAALAVLAFVLVATQIPVTVPTL